MKPRRSLLLALLALTCPTVVASQSTEEDEKPWLEPAPESIERWQDMRYGMFIHWGPNCQLGGEIGWSRKGPRRGRAIEGTGTIPMEEYDNLYKTFDPVRFDADEWVQLARDAGMRYMVITSKHHDGFSMFASEHTDYDVMSTPFGRDVVAELAEACRKGGLAFGVYYSPRDWYHPDFATERHERYLEFYLGQLRELASNYGELLVLWFDGFDSPRELWKDAPEESFEMLRGLQPRILLNNRGGLPGDFDTPEQRIRGFDRERPWETCMTLGQQWSWKPDDRMKSLEQCIHTLVRTAGGSGNLLFNVGPMPDGRIEPRQAERLRQEGAWLKPRGEAFYGTRGGPYRPGGWGASTHEGQRIFLHVLDWSGDESLELPLEGFAITGARLLPDGEEVRFEQTDALLRLSVPRARQDAIDTIVELSLEGEAAAIAPIRVENRSGSLAADRPASASNVFRNLAKKYGPGNAFDDDFLTRWATDAGISSCWIQVDLGEAQLIGRALIDEWQPRIQNFIIECRVEGEWRTVHIGRKLGRKAEVRFDAVEADGFRLYVHEASDGPTINEIQLFAR